MTDQPQQPFHDPQVVDRFLDNQAQEIDLERQRIELQGRQLEVNAVQADKAMDLQAVDRRELRAFAAKQNRNGAIFLSFLACLVVGGFLVALYWDKDALLKDIIQIVSYLIGGFVGGFGAGYMKGLSARSNSQNSGE